MKAAVNPNRLLPDLPARDAVALDYLEAEGPDLLRRWTAHQAFWDARLVAGLDAGSRVALDRPGPEGAALTRGQERVAGVNFAAQDYLGLAAHPALQAAEAEAAGRWGLHSAGPATLQGLTPPLQCLEERLADLLCCRDATLFPSGWAAGYGTLRALLREDDHVLLDALAPACFQEAAAAATRNLHRMPHCAHQAVAQRLARIRAAAPRAGILVVTDSLFALDAAVPDLRALRDACRAQGATLLVNLAHDLGALGDGGLGFLGEQGLVGEVDILCGSLARAFATNGGFVAGNAPGLKQALRGFASPLSGSAALSPPQAAVALAALDIMRSAEGARRRRRLAANIARLRERLEARAFRLPGRAACVVPVLLGGVAEGRLTTRAALGHGALVELAEHPAVSRGESRWLLHVTAAHAEAQVDRLVGIAVCAREAAQAALPGCPGAGRA